MIFFIVITLILKKLFCSIPTMQTSDPWKTFTKKHFPRRQTFSPSINCQSIFQNNSTKFVTNIPRSLNQTKKIPLILKPSQPPCFQKPVYTTTSARCSNSNNLSSSSSAFRVIASLSRHCTAIYLYTYTYTRESARLREVFNPGV